MSELHDTLNETAHGDTLNIRYEDGGGVFRVDGGIRPFGDGEGIIVCRNDVDDVVTEIREIRRDPHRVGVEQDGELTAIGVEVSIE
jgi:hypothetical protein